MKNTGQERTGQDKTRQDKIGQDREKYDRTGQDMPLKGKDRKSTGQDVKEDSGFYKWF